jgi:hypothetical protein
MRRSVMRGSLEHTAAVPDDEQGAPINHSGGQAPKQDVTGSGSHVEEMCGYQLVMTGGGLPVQEVTVHPVNTVSDLGAGSLRPASGTGECDGGDIDGSDPPPALGQPDRIGAFARTDVEGQAGGKRVDFDNQAVIGVAAPDLWPCFVERIPKGLVELFGHNRFLLAPIVR